MSMQLGGRSRDAATRPGATSLALDALLRDTPGTLVGAFGPAGVLVALPDSLELHGRRPFPGQTGLDLLVAEDQILVVEAWERTRTEPIVRIDARLAADPTHPSTIHFFDVRAEHGALIAVLETPDPDLVIRASEERLAQRRHAAKVKRNDVGVFLEVDDAMTRLLGWSAADLVGRRSTELVHPEDVERAVDTWMAMRVGSGTGRAKIRFRHAHGHYVWLDVAHDNRLDDPKLQCVVSELVDISDEMAELEALHDRERQLARLAEALPIGICHVRADREVVYSNEPMVELLGPVESLEGLVRSVAGADRSLVRSALENALGGRSGALEVGIVDGFEERRCELTFRTIASDDGRVEGIIVCAADVTDRSRLRSELEHRASHDSLSGCLNRLATVAALERALVGPHTVAVAYIDLDHFKAINDDLGHAAGDELLRVAAARLRSATRVEDRIGRIGGDEFVVIAPQGQGPFEAKALADRLTEAINGDVVFGRQRIQLRASVGVTVALDGEHDAEAVLSRADAAMYEVKRRSREQRQLRAGT